ncbi:neurensin-2 isoform X2 [Sagmatias obliquidens]|uniref:Neurensin-2 isoform X2 n=1 Tax=Tursiops truncatus TaxID=9739 RepID=A0A6J3Q4J8_TURTR|nr:neurensin-2 isoform X2 [Lagenorhynchus obliquidens]XP_030686454.1 neurensin-2 isoform X2 [Globicephala melas]XP_033697013.1 neurensin-2 isoform X2 [Tursiops truncatus]
MPSCERPCGCSRGPNVEDGKWYGVRSYLHLFYEDCAGTPLSDDPEGPPVLCRHRRWPSLCWKISLSSGTLLLLLGLAALTTGYAVPPKLEGIGEGWLSQDPKAEPLDTETDGHMEVFGDELEQQLSPIFHDTSGRSWFSPPASHFGQSSVQTIQPKRDF